MGETPAPPAHLLIEPLAPHHDRAAFSCGVPTMDAYLRDTALHHAGRHVSRVCVAIPAAGSSEILAYYTLSNYALMGSDLPRSLGRGLPTRFPLPATLLGQLAVATRYQSAGLGKKLLLHALREALRATHHSASLGVVVDAVTDDLIPFYQKRGFVPLLDRPQHLIAPMNRIHAMFPDDAAGLPAIEVVLQAASAAAAVMEDLQAALLTGGATMTSDRMAHLLHELQRHLDAMTGRR